MYVAQWKFPEALASINRALSLKITFIEAQNDKEKIIAWVKAAEEKEMQSATAT